MQEIQQEKMHLAEITKLALGEINMLMIGEMKQKAFEQLSIPGKIYSKIAGFLKTLIFFIYFFRFVCRRINIFILCRRLDLYYCSCYRDSE